MPAIRVLPDAVVNRIAAGEVVERPAAVLKELMENALDAGARTVRVRLEGSMGSLVAVVDDGCGMSADDALLALERHATSKIATLEEVSTVSTLGFRGEALPSIAAVSHLTLETKRPADEAGVRVEIQGGRVLSAVPAALPDGTAVTVRRLFYATPARRKFLRTPPTERGHLLRVFQRLALANPGVRFELVVDNDAPLVLPAADRRERLAGVLGRRLTEDALPVDTLSGGIRVEGLLGDPRRPSPTRHHHLFVNGRPVEDRLLWTALREGLGPGTVPPGDLDVILFLTMDPGEVDVNVHPAKREVRFAHPGRVSTALGEAVRKAVGRPGGIPGGIPVVSISGPPPWQPSAEVPPSPIGRQEAMRLAEPPVATYHPAPASGASSPPETNQPVLLGQVLGCYLVAADAGRLLLVDQHAAHERVVYERVLDRLAAGSPASQELLFPEELELSPDRMEFFLPRLDLLERAGCRLEPFGPGILRVLALPPEVPPDELRLFLGHFFALVEESGEPAAGPDWAQRLAALVACHGAVKAGDRLGAEAAQALLRSLVACRDPHHCPHGRPTTVALDRDALERLFGRR